MRTGASRALGAILLVLALSGTYVQAKYDYHYPPYTVLDLAAKAGANEFIGAVKAAGLEKALSDPHLVATIFIPTDKAFKAAGAVPPELLLPILQYHVVPGRVISSRRLLFAGKLYTLLQPKFLYAAITKKWWRLRIVGETNNVGIVKANLYTKKAIVHIVDGVLVPKFPAPAPKASPPPPPPPPPPPAIIYPPPPSPPPPAVAACKTVFDLVAATPDLSELGKAVVAAGLQGALSTPTLQATIVAPINKAFAKVPAGISKELLTKVLLLHVIPGPGLPSSAVVANLGKPFNTLAEQPLVFKYVINKKTYKTELFVFSKVNYAKVIAVDILACNGTIIHLIDTVLLPKY